MNGEITPRYHSLTGTFSSILKTILETMKYFQTEIIGELLARILITLSIVLGKGTRGKGQLIT